MRDRKVATKVLTVAGAAIAGTVVTGVVSLIGISSLQQTRTSEIQRAVPYVTSLNNAALAAKAAANDERGYLIRGDGKFRDEALGRKKTVDGELDKAGPLGDTAKVEQIRTATDAWFTALETEFTTYAGDRPAAIDAALGANRDLRKAYEEMLAAEIARADAALIAGRDFDATARSTRTVVVLVFAVAVLLAVGLAIAVTRMIRHPLHRVSAVLDAVADGDLTQDAAVEQHDELGQMAGSLRRAIGSLRRTVGDLADHSATLGAAAAALSGTSRASAEGVADGARQAEAVAGSAAIMSTNIQTVAAGAEQMGASIREISNGASQAAQIASRAVEVTTSTTAVMAKLGESSAEIGSVLKVITAIAEQTNLLALNATIEAARAGEMGKGFAVVASEVKDLAQETAKATDEVSRRIGAIQEDTGGAVAAIDEITQIIAQINEFQTTIASAVEEQTVTTNEMSRNVAEAASNGGQVAASVTRTTDGVAESQRAAE